ncbi:glycoside hydrolase family 2 protein [Thermothielavioides terrestris NRRL 8126]|uniref:Glycoside hydrolase family 2 protein n=1 Tax=Thermothielavioides terrestris (strain ATCC 38088 / NRRL 8126) TaxID=578455 RepID=G2QZK1_THETT|nr:glycoside hydrolase family 2 protein [Thermothielavioides terrestris NRRL 8126]AEO65527.1 glycoside hydrolase family 2 protein [Thermothielavioides terrestris NRRL 8126]
MLILLQLPLLLCAWLLAGAEAAAPYKLLAPPLDTPWTSKVGTNPWPQYPRPQLRRDAWQSLNGIWTYQPAQGAGDVANPPALPLSQEVLIPSCIESGISGIMKMGVTHMWFGTTFTIPPNWPKGQRVLLNFEAVDYEATVFVNGTQVGFHRGGYSRFSLDITSHVVRNGPNQVHVFVFDPTDDQSIPQGKQTKRLSHIFYTPCTGIWQTVWLETVPDNYITGVDIAADMHGTVNVTVHSRTQKSTPVKVSVEGEQGGIIASQLHASDEPFTFSVSSPKLWSPDSPTLYNVTITMGTDVVKSYTGFRTISSGVVHGIKRPLLNGEFVFLFGPLDQGFWPDGIYTPPTIEAMVYDLKVIKGLGMNMLRKHIKVETDLFYEACDRLGLMVIQDMPSMRVYTNARPSDAEQAEFQRQLEVMVNDHKSHPSIVTWIIYNEGWGQRTDYFPEFAITDRIRQLDPTRLVDAVTGWYDHGAGDFSDNHHYADPQCGTPFYSLNSSPFDPNRIGFQGEFGGIGLRPADANLWPVPEAVATINQTYELHEGADSFHYRAHVLLGLLRDQVERWACSGAVYTQTTDVEGEVNGLMTYDRRVVRVDQDRWRQDIAALYRAAKARA